jgi:hypothetical protein
LQFGPGPFLFCDVCPSSTTGVTRNEALAGIGGITMCEEAVRDYKESDLFSELHCATERS